TLFRSVGLQLTDRIEIVDGNAMLLEALGTGFRTGDVAIEKALELGQGIDEEVGGGPRADANDTAVGQMRLDVVHRRIGNDLLECILGHDLIPSEWAGELYQKRLPFIRIDAARRNYLHCGLSLSSVSRVCIATAGQASGFCFLSIFPKQCTGQADVGSI